MTALALLLALNVGFLLGALWASRERAAWLMEKSEFVDADRADAYRAALELPRDVMTEPEQVA